MLQALLDAGAIIDDTEMMFHHSALMVAALNGHEKTVDILLKAGANTLLKDTSGRSALLLAASNQHLSVLTKLLDSGEQPDQIDFNGNNIWHLIAMSDFANDNSKKNFESEQKKDPELIITKNLIPRGIILDSLNKDGESALMIAVKKGNLAIIKKLLELGASSKILSPDGESALTLAETSGNVEVLNLLK